MRSAAVADTAGGARASCVGGSRRRSRAGPFSRAVVSLPFLVLLSSCPSLRARRSLAPPARWRGARAPRAGARTHVERDATRAVRGESAGSPLFFVAVRGLRAGCVSRFGSAASCYASSGHHRPHRRSLRRSRRCSRRARAARPLPLAPSFAPPFYPVRASTRAIARATTTHAAAPTPPACVMTTRARISSRSPSRTKRTSRGNERAIWGVRGAVRTWRFVVTVARRRRRRSACLIFLEKHIKK
jgi:hypothetical protein